MASNGAGKFSFSFGGVTGPSKSPGAAATAQPAPMSNMDLLLAKAKAPPSTTTSQAKKPIRFDDEDEDDGPAQAQPVASSSKPKPPRPKPSLLDGPPAPAPSHVKQTTSMSRAEKRLQSEALALDSTAFQYDEVYDNLKAAERKVEQAKKQDTSERKSKYMESFLESARRRKLDQLHAEEKMMQIEREKEGGEFDDKEKFVTSAYKAQMEEVRKAEEEERKKEEELRKSKKGPGLTAFYKTMLEDSEAKHAAAVASASGSVDSGPSLAIRPPTASRETEVDDEAEYDPFLARQAESSTAAGNGQAETSAKAKAQAKYGDDVEINDEGEVVDKRTLLKAGLNITKKPAAALPDSLKSGSRSGTQLEGPYQSRAVGSAASHRERMARERKRLEEQMREEAEKKKRDEVERLRAEEEEVRKRREGVDGEAERRRKEAKERFLARKRAREQGGDAAGEGDEGTKKAKEQ